MLGAWGMVYCDVWCKGCSAVWCMGCIKVYTPYGATSRACDDARLICMTVWEGVVASPAGVKIDSKGMRRCSHTVEWYQDALQMVTLCSDAL